MSIFLIIHISRLDTPVINHKEKGLKRFLKRPWVLQKIIFFYQRSVPTSWLTSMQLFISSSDSSSLVFKLPFRAEAVQAYSLPSLSLTHTIDSYPPLLYSSSAMIFPPC